jgi:hypothetical protein
VRQKERTLSNTPTWCLSSPVASPTAQEMLPSFQHCGLSQDQPWISDHSCHRDGPHPPSLLLSITPRKRVGEGDSILKQACSPEYQRAQYAFKDSMIHGILQFTLRIAFRCVLHRCESQEIRCQKLFLLRSANANALSALGFRRIH